MPAWRRCERSGERFEVIAHDLRRRDILTAAKSIEPDLVIMDLAPRDAVRAPKYQAAQAVIHDAAGAHLYGSWGGRLRRCGA